MKSKRDINRIKYKANCAIRDRNRQLADILASIKILSTERSQETAERGAAANKPANSSTNKISDARPQRADDKCIAAATSQGNERVNADARQPPVKRPSESEPLSSIPVSTP